MEQAYCLHKEPIQVTMQNAKNNINFEYTFDFY